MNNGFDNGFDNSLDNRFDNGFNNGFNSGYNSGYNIVEEWERKRGEMLIFEQKRIKRRLMLRTFAGMLMGVLFTLCIFAAGFMFRGAIIDSLLDGSNNPAATVSSEDRIVPSLRQGGEGSSIFNNPFGGFGGSADNGGSGSGNGGDSDSSGGGGASGASVSASGGFNASANGGSNTGSNTGSSVSGLSQNSVPGSDASNSQIQDNSESITHPLMLQAGESPILTIPQIYNKVSPSIVGVKITFQSQGYSFGWYRMPEQEQSGEGSGIIISVDGYVMTNYHVISSAIDRNTRKAVEGSKIEVFLPDDATMTPYNATLVGFDVNTDLAVLKIEKPGLIAAELGDPDMLEIGELAVAIGNPGGMEYMSSCTVGVISGLNRTIQTEGYKNIQLIQTDAAINPGNSGGALINSKGQVIGVNSIKIASSSFEGLGFAIPINKAVEICNDLIDYTYVTGRPQIGITASSEYTESLAERYNMPKGVYVFEVEENGPAAIAGIRKNDIIVKLGGSDITNFERLEEVKARYKPNDIVDVRVYRDWSTNNYAGGIYVDIKITLGEMKN